MYSNTTTVIKCITLTSLDAHFKVSVLLPSIHPSAHPPKASGPMVYGHFYLSRVPRYTLILTVNKHLWIDCRICTLVGERICPHEMKSHVTTSTKWKNINRVHRGLGDAELLSDLSGWVSWGKFPRACKFWDLNLKFKVMDMNWWRGGPFQTNAQRETMQDITQARTSAYPTLPFPCLSSSAWSATTPVSVRRELLVT